MRFLKYDLKLIYNFLRSLKSQPIRRGYKKQILIWLLHFGQYSRELKSPFIWTYFWFIKDWNIQISFLWEAEWSHFLFDEKHKFQGNYRSNPKLKIIYPYHFRMEIDATPFEFKYWCILLPSLIYGIPIFFSYFLIFYLIPCRSNRILFVNGLGSRFILSIKLLCI